MLINLQNQTQDQDIIAFWYSGSNQLIGDYFSDLQNLLENKDVDHLVVISDLPEIQEIAKINNLTVFNSLADISELDPKLQSLNKNKDHLFFVTKQDSELKFIDLRPDLEPDKDWCRVIKDFCLNYKNNTPDENNYWRWGQIVPTSGEYLCIDCGYIQEFTAGDVFPICEVCLAGDINGPSEYDGSENNGYWELI